MVVLHVARVFPSYFIYILVHVYFGKARRRAGPVGDWGTLILVVASEACVCVFAVLAYSVFIMALGQESARGVPKNRA